MLIAPAKYAGEFKPPKGYGKVSGEDLNSPSEAPEQWKNGKDYEADFATAITHSRIKNFCDKLREIKDEDWSQDAPYLIPLYYYFIDDANSEEECIPGLYEKLCYVRDRTVYRPSYVQTVSGEVVQTSAQLGSELRSLPNAAYLYHAITEVYKAILYKMEQTRKMGEHDSCIQLLTKIWFGKVNEGDLEDLCALGHPKERLQELGECDEDKKYTLPTHISHLLEMESIDFVCTYQEKYWASLKKACQDSWKLWRRREEVHT